MSIIYLSLVLLIILMIVGIVGFYLWDKRKEIKDILIVRKHARKKDKLLIDYWRIDEVFITRSEHKNKMVHEYTWVHCEESELYQQDYLKAEKWMDQLRYVGVPVYVRLHNFKCLDTTKMENPNRITSSVMYNVYQAQNMKRYISGMTKVQFAPIDIKSLGVMIPVIIGIALGMLYFLR